MSRNPLPQEIGRDNLVQVYRSPLKLRFVDSLESRFHWDYAQRVAPFLRVGLTAATLLFLLSGWIDQVLLAGLPVASGEALAEIWFYRYAVAGPVLILLTMGLFTPIFKPYHQAFVAVFIAVLFAALMAMWGIAPPAVKPFYFTGSLIVEMAGLTIAWLHFRNAIQLAFGLALLGLGLSWMDVGTSPAEWISYGYYHLAVGFIGAAASFFSERSARRDYLQKLLLNREHEQLELANQHLQRLVESDPLTGIANRRHFDLALQEEWRRARRGEYPVSLLMIDADDFKAYNDHYGHPMGDKALIALARALQLFAKRPGDLVARYGGEEFVMILPSTDREHARHIAEALCAAIKALQIPHAHSRVSPWLTASIGGATAMPSALLEPAQLLDQADKALYEAKRRGRNRVEWSI